jgi:RNA polymerase sigma factor (sigma-70 family)
VATHAGADVTTVCQRDRAPQYDTKDPTMSTNYPASQTIENMSASRAKTSAPGPSGGQRRRRGTRPDHRDNDTMIKRVVAARHARHALGSSDALTDDEADRYRTLIAGGDVARGELVEANENLVHHLVRRYRTSGVDDDELHAVGMVGLLEAIDTFDPARGAALSTHASWQIRQAISTAVRAHVRHTRRTVDAAIDIRSHDGPTPDDVGGRSAVDVEQASSSLADVLVGLPDRERAAVLAASSGDVEMLADDWQCSTRQVKNVAARALRATHNDNRCPRTSDGADDCVVTSHPDQHAVQRPHGTRARYVFGADSADTEGCRCERCTDANRSYEQERRSNGSGRVDAELSRAHLEALSEAGIGKRVVAQRARLSVTTIANIRSGRTRTVAAATQASILAVELPSPSGVPDK